jgi:hypothetical protein
MRKVISTMYEGANAMLIGYYKCYSLSERNKKYPIHVLYNINAWEESTLRQRGLLGNRFAVREATPNEIEVVKGNKRAVSYRYETLEGLVSDELCSGSSQKFIETLVTAFKEKGGFCESRR